MYDIRWIRDNEALFEAGRRSRGLEPLAGKLFALDDVRRAAIAQLQAAQERRNAASKDIGQAMKDKDSARADALKAEVAALKDQMAIWEADERNAVAALEEALLKEPNTPLPETPVGKDEHDNIETRVVGAKPAMDFTPREHFELGEALGLMDFDVAAKMSGARFVVLKGPLARMERALMQFMLDLHTDVHGYMEVDPPLLVRDEAMYGTAQLPKFRDDQFAAGDGYWLIPTAEVPLTNLVRESILDEKQLPMRMTAGTACFRAEA